MSSLSGYLVSLLNILTLCSLTQRVLGDVDFIFIGDLSQYTTNGVCTYGRNSLIFWILTANSI